MILDGWGIAKNKKASAIDRADTPYMDCLLKKYPHSKLKASGLAVGLPKGQMGNSEVGHMNIGGGRIVYQDLVKINNAIKDRSLSNNKTLLDTFDYAKKDNKKIHFIGLVSDGGVHAHIEHLKALCSIAHQKKLKEVYVHVFTDGRDTSPNSGVHYLKEMQKHLDKTTGAIASITGRYFAMDRDNRWQRVKVAYDAMVHGKGSHTEDLVSGVQKSYSAGVTDEFIKPIIHTDTKGQIIGKIESGDIVFCFNFRSDRCRQITQTLTQKNFPEHNMKKLNLHYVTMTNYDNTFEGIYVVFDKDNLTNTLGEVLASCGKKQIRIAETEKYPHVTFFFSGGREKKFSGEKRLLCPSPKVATYDLQPEMSAKDIQDKIVPELNSQYADFICLNFSNPDMVGHTGDFQATVTACEVVDKCVEKVTETALENDYTTIIIADHGNSDCMINEDGSPNTAHTTSLVPCILVDKTAKRKIKDGKLADLAPTILKLMGITTPKEMTGNVLIK